ncbi:protein of unknown function [Candidatus Nitrospira inopinata]|uniref:Uncharacterized protein n=1 Tax=Candidatus Nitrospira inopinata TaxID=1715989 RepID=A0A0S4KSR9_9BACT|nr:protein of unknown function [Candidatus Nitrospira inopinata]
MIQVSCFAARSWPMSRLSSMRVQTLLGFLGFKGGDMAILTSPVIMIRSLPRTLVWKISPSRRDRAPSSSYASWSG